MKNYEIMFIVRPDVDEATVKKFKSGYYFLYNIETSDDAAVKEFDRVARIDENVVRHLVINLDK